MVGWVSDGIRGPRIIVIVQIQVVLVTSLGVTSGRCSKSIQLGIEGGLGFDEGSAIILHWLISSIWVLSDESIGGCDQNQNQENQGESGVEDKEDDTHNTGHDTWLVEYLAVKEEEDAVGEIDGTD